jgi:ATP-binding cassette subfamily B protein
MFAIIFLFGNMLIAAYYFYNFDSILKKNKDFEDKTQKSDGAMIDLLSNMDKIIYRGKIKEESYSFEKLQEEGATSGMEYYSNSNLHSTIMLGILTAVFLISLGYLIKLRTMNNIDQIKFMTSLTVLLLFREKLTTVVEQLPDFIGFIGRMEIALKYFDHINTNFERVMQNNRFKKKKLEFKHIKFDNVTYKYGSGKNVYKNRNYDVKLKENEIVGITGPSGSGKSTFIKLLIKMYPCNNGNIFIDGTNIDDLDPSFIRENITYVNQNSKLFDKKVIENMLYGCNDPKKCKVYLEKIMKYPTISKLYKNMDIYKKEAGLLGENLSGGQRQIVNMIGGFINPSKILVLDEPTNALDPVLKKEIIGLIKDFKQYKQNIIIITHDKDVMRLFDTEIKMKTE